MRFLVFVLAGVSFLQPAGAAKSADAVQAHPAVGRLNHAGYRSRQHCTAFLAGPGLALTAAHCVDGLRPDDLHLLLGYRQGVWDAHLRPTAVRWDAGGADVAALCVGSEAPWLPPASAPPDLGERLLVLGYGRPRVHVATATTCTVTDFDGSGRLRLDCPLPPGASGAPVLRSTVDGHEVIAVVSMSSKTASLAIRAPALTDPALCRDARSLDGTAARRRSSR